MKPSVFYFGTLSLVLAHAACGGKVTIDAPGSDNGTGGATSTIGVGGTTTGFGGAIGDTSSSSGFVTTSSSGFSTTSTSSSGFSTTSTSSSGFSTTSSTSSGSTTTSTSSSTSSSTSTTSTSSSSGAPVTVACNGGQCMPGDVCCFNPSGPGDHCGQSGQCDPGFAQFSCNGPNDCPGSICCATLDPTKQSLTGIACQATCDADDELVVCNMMAPNVCMNGTQCHGIQQLGTGAGYRFCVGP